MIAAAVVVLGWLAAVVTYRLSFGELPPTRLNLLYWVDGDSADCVDRAVEIEEIPFLATGVTLDDICPGSA